MSAAVPRAEPEEVVRAFVEHLEALRTEFDRQLTGHPVTEADVFAHSAWQRKKVEGFDDWLTASGWTSAQLFELLRSAAERMRPAVPRVRVKAPRRRTR